MNSVSLNSPKFSKVYKFEPSQPTGHVYQFTYQNQIYWADGDHYSTAKYAHHLVKDLEGMEGWAFSETETYKKADKQLKFLTKLANQNIN